VLYYKVGDWHLCKRDHYDKPIPRNIKPPAATVKFPLGRELVRCRSVDVLGNHQSNLFQKAL